MESGSGCGRRPKRQAKGPRLLAEAEPCDDFAVAVHVFVVQVAELAAPLANKHQETTSRVVIVLVRLQVRRQVLDPFGQDRYLDFRGAGVCGVDAIVLDQRGLLLFGQQPCSSVFLCLAYEHRSTYHI